MLHGYIFLHGYSFLRAHHTARLSILKVGCNSAPLRCLGYSYPTLSLPCYAFLYTQFNYQLTPVAHSHLHLHTNHHPTLIRGSSFCSIPTLSHISIPLITISQPLLNLTFFFHQLVNSRHHSNHLSPLNSTATQFHLSLTGRPLLATRHW